VSRERPIEACREKLARLHLRGLVERAARSRGATIEEVLGDRRTKRVAAGRRIGMLAVLAARPNMSLTDLGELFGARHHTTVIGLLKPVTEDEQRDADALARELRSIGA
jgi:chromosomal replication initiation ATPase DnaA